MKRSINIMDILREAINSKTFAILSPILTLAVSGLMSLLKKDLTWFIVSMSIALVMLAVMFILSAQVSNTHKDIIEKIIEKDGIFDAYMAEKVDSLATSIEISGSCMKDVQKECKKNIEKFFLAQYSAIKY